MHFHLTSSQLNDTKQYVKWTTIAVYITLNSILLVFLRYATILGNDKVITTTEVLISEIIKLILASVGCFIFDAKCNINKLKSILWYIATEDASDLIKLSIPAVLYIIQNNLQYLIETKIILIVIYQFKVVTTALFYVFMLSRRIYVDEWLCIAAVTVGVSIVELSQHDIEGHYHAELFIGIISVLVAITTSGFAGVYYEKILKTSKLSIWVLNMELSLVSFIFGLIICSTQNTEEISKFGFFYAYNWYTVVLITLQSVVGIAVSQVVFTSDNIHKCFAASISLVIVAFLDVILFPSTSEITQTLITGATLVIISCAAFVVHSHRQHKAAIFHQQHLTLLQQSPRKLSNASDANSYTRDRDNSQLGSPRENKRTASSGGLYITSKDSPV